VRNVAEAGPAQVETVYRESFSLWGGGLSYESYHALWTELQRTPWGRERSRFWVLGDGDGRVLSSVKQYHPAFRLDGRTVPGTVIGALFTPAAERGKGYARDVLTAVLERAREEGDRLALLYSDVGTAFYESVGFRPVPTDEVIGRLPRRELRTAPAGWRVEPLGSEHRLAAAAARRASTARARFSVDRDEGLWDFLRSRARGFFDRFPESTVRSRSSAVLDRGRFAGYVVAVEGRSEWSVREVAAADGDPATETQVLRVAAREASGRGLRRVHGWLDRAITDRLPSWRWVRTPRRRSIPMLAGLAGGPLPPGLFEPGAVELSFLDQF
jgi:GNAT superfamily N-acetyltransferase